MSINEEENSGMNTTKRIVASILVCLILITMLSACETSSQLGQNDYESETRTIIDIAGDEVEIPTQVNTAVNLVPFGCQIMMGLSLEEYLIGINEETVETPWLEFMCPNMKDIPLFGYEPDVEAVLAVHPDVVFCADQETAREFRSKGLPAVTIMYYSIDDFKNVVSLIGDIFGGNAKVKCQSYLEYFDSVVADVDSKLKDVVKTRETLYYINGTADRGFYKTAGAGSTNDAVAKLSFAEFATNSILQSPETKVDAEAILAQNPENIIIGGRWQHVLYDELMAAPEWANIAAVQDNHVFKVPMSMTAWNRYSIEIALMIPWTAAVIYPEYYEFDALHETIDFYRNFTDIELTEKQAEYILEGLTPDGEKEIANR